MLQNKSRTHSRSLLMMSAMWVLTSMAQSAAADTYFVRISGNNANNGTTPETAFASPSKAASVMVAGDIVYIGAGEYTSQIAPSASGTAENSIQYIADLDGKKTSDAGEVIIKMSGSPVISVSGISNTSFDGFTIRGGYYNVQIINSASDITIQNCLIDQSSKHGVLIRDSTDIQILGSSIQGSGEDGINIEMGASIEIANCQVSKSSKKGIKAKKSGTSITIDRCVVDQNGNHGLSFEDGVTAVVLNTLTTRNKDGIHTHKGCNLKIWNITTALNNEHGIKAHDGATIEIVNTISFKNNKDGIRLESRRGKKGKNSNLLVASCHHNISFDNKDKDWNGLTPGTTDQSVDPEFLSSSNYQLGVGSPARDVGTDASSMTDYDLNDKNRPENTGWDIGCYEGLQTPKDFYVRTNGSDQNSGLVPGKAFRSIQHAVNRCTVPGSTIYVGPGVYFESVEIGSGAGSNASSGTAIAPCKIIADVSGLNTRDDPGVVVINGNGSKVTGVSVTSREHWIIDGFIIRGQRDYGFKATSAGLSVLNCTVQVPRSYGIYATAEGDVTIADCVFERSAVSGHVIWVSPMNKNTPTSVTITRNDATMKGSLYQSTGLSQGLWRQYGRGRSYRRYTYGIIVYGTNRPIVDQITIANNQLSDFYLPIYSYVYSSKRANVSVANNTITGSLYSIYSYINQANRALLTNNIVDNCYYGLLSYSYRGKPATVAGILEHNVTYNMSGLKRSFEFDVISADPKFVDAKSGDFSLNSGSPAIDAGTDFNVPATDIAGRSRPSDGNKDGIAVVDLGAYELVKESDRVRVVKWREVGSEHNR